MVSVICKGGLGNQLFQIAFGANQALKQGKPLRLLFAESTMIHGGFWGRKFAEALSDHLALSCHRLGRVSDVIIESPDREVMTIPPGDFCFDGYWQGQAYHREFCSVIHRSFASVLNSRGVDPDLDVCLIHRRLGDYLHPVNRAKHGVLADSYFDRAKTAVGSSQEFVWSTDSPELLSDNEMVIESFFEGLNDPIDVLSAMTRFPSIITSNSSFSWWAAVLRREKTVVRPSLWLREPSPLDHRMDIAKSITINAEFI